MTDAPIASSPTSEDPFPVRRARIFLAVLVVGALVAAGWLAARAWPIARGVAVTGTIVGFEQRADEQQSSAPVVEFVPSGGGDTVTFTNDAGTVPGDEAGDRVPVRYERGHTDNASIDRFLDLWLLPVIFAGIAALLVVLAVALGPIVRASERRR